MGVLLSFLFIFQFRSARWMYMAAGFILLFTFQQWSHYFESTNKKKWIVYSIKGHHAMEWSHRGQSYFDADTALLHDEKRMRFHVFPNRLLNEVTTVQSDSIPFRKSIKGVQLFYWNHQVIASIREKQAAIPANATVNYLVIGNNAVSWEEIRKIKADHIILDASNSPRWVNQMKQLAYADRIIFHSVMDEGAFIVSN